jgi:hypothetical protein
MQNHHHKTSPFECGFRAKSDEMRGIGDTAPGGESAERGQTDASSRKADLDEQAEHVCPGLGARRRCPQMCPCQAVERRSARASRTPLLSGTVYYEPWRKPRTPSRTRSGLPG